MNSKWIKWFGMFGLLVGVAVFPGCEFKCESDADSVEDVVDEIGDEIEEITDEK